MFWRLVPGDIIETLAEFTNEDWGFVWRVEKTNWKWQLEELGRSSNGVKRAWHTTEHKLKAFWQVFVDDRPFESDAINKHAHIQSKAVFSYAMTVMDSMMKKRSGWFQNLRHACGCTPNACSARIAGIPEAKDVIHHAKRELGLRRSFRRT